ncbi:unnamed protein product [Rotaria socialis]|uniref:Uncharacterized protein n=1 Tax=Rotaria socialis TaxID=392032 RepID=A0A820CB84_9BILA|nr:unnamed protein product [Rotaria socialis]CAF3330208.1 unnamed protein product [Rotaria socialis]CAF3342517.1 unnamed protein product [Rotaria socialis]CAF3362016.1 unnamed protein product [Rotaria socialis]CAF3615838.1 unnamed protein product [Rotaria socialis]
MTHLRMVTFALVLLIIVHFAVARTRDLGAISTHQKRFLGCAVFGKRCLGLFGKSCCGDLVCNTTSGKCVRKGSSTSWLHDRNGR